MTDRDHRHPFMERILHLLHLLEEHHLELDQISKNSLPPKGLNAQEQQELQVALDCIRFLDEIPGGFLICRMGEDQRIIYANRGVLRIFQCGTLHQLRQLTGGSFRGAVYAEDLEAVEDAIRKQFLSEKRDLDYVEYRVRRRDGAVRWVESYGHFVRDSAIGDAFYVFLGDHMDERSQQEMEQKRLLAEALEKADLAVKAKNAFLSQISHEMRTPLNAIFGFAALAKSTLHDPSTAGNYLNQLETASRQLLNMISEALDVSELSSAAGSAQEECDLRETLQEVYDFLLPQAQEKSIAFALDCRHILHRGVYANPEHLKQLVLNLANNAITYTDPGGRVEINLTEEEALPDNHAVYRLEVKDNGIGIGEEFLEKVFEPFTREKNSTLSGIRGIGLGLTIAKGIVDLLEGTISVKTAPNQGSVFTAMLPFLVQPLPNLSGSQSVSLRTNLRILLAEDNEINREIETDLLELIGFVVDPVSDGGQALEKMKRAFPGDYDLLLLDLQMPVMNGWEVAAAVRKLPDPVMARIPIIALSANVAVSDRMQSRESGIDVHLPKPMDLNVLLETIEKLINRHAG